MWSLKARILLALALVATLVAVATAQWFPFLVAVALALHLTYSQLVFRAEGGLVGSRQLELDRIREGDEVGVTTSLTNQGDRTAFMELRDRLPRQCAIDKGRPATVAALEPGEDRTLEIEISTPLMGVYDIGPLEVRLEDPYGLYHDEQVVYEPSQLIVMPAKGPVDDLEPVVSTFQNFQGDYAVNQPGDGFDFYGLREYVPGDVYRAINWKASAKTGDLMVNQFERTTSTEITFLIDGRAITHIGPEDATPFVQVSRAVATLIEDFFGKRDVPRTFVYGDGIHQVRPGTPDRVVNETLETLAMWEPSGDEPLSHAIGEILPRLVEGTPVILFSPMLDDPTILESVATLLAHDLIVLAVAPPLPDLEGLGPAEAQALRAGREAVLDGLRGFDVDVVQPDHLEEKMEVVA